MTGQELRKEERFPASILPHYLQSVRVLFGGLETFAKVIDASLSGFGFQIEKSLENFVLGTSLVIYPEGLAKALYGIVVFAKSVDGKNTRVGVQLREVGQFVEYQTELRQIISLVTNAES